MRVISPPETIPYYPREATLFLAGSIEQDTAERWQDAVVEELFEAAPEANVLILNPRRANWDPSWEQTKNNPQFRAQVEWELFGLETATRVLFYFDPNTKSPITLAELGIIAAQKPEAAWVVCPEGFWRKGNVDVMCEVFGMRQWPSLGLLMSSIRLGLIK